VCFVFLKLEEDIYFLLCLRGVSRVCFFGVVVLLSWWLVNGSSDKEYCYFAAILHSSNHQLVYGHIYITTRYYRVMV